MASKKVKQSLPTFPIVRLKLTTKQQREPDAFRSHVKEAGGAWGILGQAFIREGQRGEPRGTAEFHFINPAAFKILNAALLSARKKTLGGNLQ